MKPNPETRCQFRMSSDSQLLFSPSTAFLKSTILYDPMIQIVKRTSLFGSAFRQTYSARTKSFNTKICTKYQILILFKHGARVSAPKFSTNAFFDIPSTSISAPDLDHHLREKNPPKGGGFGVGYSQGAYCISMPLKCSLLLSRVILPSIFHFVIPLPETGSPVDRKTRGTFFQGKYQGFSGERGTRIATTCIPPPFSGSTLFSLKAWGGGGSFSNIFEPKGGK